MSNNPNLPESENTVDLLALCVNACKSIGRGLTAMFKGIGVAIAACVGFVVRHFFLLLGAGVCGLVIIIILSGLASEERYLEGEAKLRCNAPLQDIEIIVDKLGQQTVTSTVLLASELRLDPKLVKKISLISFGYGMDIDNDNKVDYAEYDKNKATDIYKETILKGGNSAEQIVKTPIRIKVADCGFLKIGASSSTPAEFQKMGQAVLDYINRQPSLQLSRQLACHEMEMQITEITTQRDMLDSLLRIEYFINSKLRAASYAQGGDKLLLADYKNDLRNSNGTSVDYRDILSLTEQKNKLTSRLAQAQDVVKLQSDFLPLATATRTLKFGLLLVWMTCFAIGALIYDYRKPLGEYIRRQRQ